MNTMNIVKAAALALLLLRPAAASSQTSSTEGLTLQRAIQRVLESHPAIRQATQGVIASRARIAERRAAYYPEIDAQGLYSRVGPVPTIELPGQGSFAFFPRNNYDANLQLRQTLLDFGKRTSNERLARSLEISATDNVEMLKSRLAYQTVAEFFAILYLQENLDVQDEQIDALDHHLAVTREKERTGTATEFEVLTTRVRVATANSHRVDTANSLERAVIELRGMLGSPTGQRIELVGDFEIAPPALDVDSLTRLALRQRPELGLARDRERTAEFRSRIAARTDNPSVSLGVDLGFKNGYVPDLNRMKTYFSAGLTVEVPVFDGFRARQLVQESEADLGAAREYTRDVARQVLTEIQQAIADVRASQEKMRAAELQLTQAEEAVAMARLRYRAGVITNLDVLDAETSLAEAKLIQLRSRYDLATSTYDLRRAVGDRIW